MTPFALTPAEQEGLLARFLRYVQVDTQSDDAAECFPTTEKQKDLARLLVEELKALGCADAEMDAWGYVMATVPERHTRNLRSGLQTFALPVAVADITLSMLWHPRLDADPLHRWLRNLLREVCAD